MQRLFIDVREPYEYQAGHVDGAISVPPSDLLAGAPQLKNVPKDTELVLYCYSGSRSRVAIEILKQQGYTNLVNGVNQGYVQQKYSE